MRGLRLGVIGIVATALALSVGCGSSKKSTGGYVATQPSTSGTTGSGSTRGGATTTPGGGTTTPGGGTTTSTLTGDEPVIQRLSDPPTGLPGGAITFAYIVADPQGDRVNAEFEYRSVSETTWHRALPDLSSPAFLGITASPTGTTYLFIWESGTNLPSVNGDYVFRVRAGDQVGLGPRWGAWVVTQPFRVTNP